VLARCIWQHLLCGSAVWPAVTTAAAAAVQQLA
jgi:hypothetical protein